MRVDRNSLDNTVRIAENNIRRFAPDTRDVNHLRHRLRQFAMIFFLYLFCRRQNIPRFGAIKSACMNRLLESVYAAFRFSRADVILKLPIFFEKCRRHLVHFFVGALGAQLNRDQQFPRVRIMKRNLRLRKKFFKRPRNFLPPRTVPRQVFVGNHVYYGIIVIEMKRQLLPKQFFNCPTLTVARQLLGKFLVRRWRGREIALMITEVEAYDGPFDLASHASRGRTPRTTIMFGASGRFYIYFTYGMHWLVNVVTGNVDYPAAVLLRAGVVKTGDVNTNADIKKLLIKGPARLTKFLKITGALNGAVASRKTGLWFEDRGIKIPAGKIKATKRVGVDYAGPIWSAKEYNFQIQATFSKL